MMFIPQSGFLILSHGHKGSIWSKALANAVLIVSLAFAGTVRATDFHIAVAAPTRLAVEQAIDAARMHRNTVPEDRIIIDLPAGTIRVESPIVISAADSGMPGAELVLRGDPAGTTVISGGVVLSAPDASPGKPIALSGVTFPSLVLDVRFPNGPRFDAAFALYQGDRRITPTRLPAAGYTTRPLKALDPTGRRVAIAFDPTTFAMLAKQKNLWISGYPAYDWQHELVPVVDTDPATNSLIIERVDDTLRPKELGRVAVLNGDFDPSTPGTAQIDQVAGTASLRPWGSRDALEIIRSPSVLSIEAANSVRVERIAFEKAGDAVVTVRDSRDILFSDCFMGQSLNYALLVRGGGNVELRRCVVSDVGRSAANIAGGERTTLGRGDHRVVDTIVSQIGIIRPTSPAISLQGVGQLIYGSLITRGGHWGIQLSGNDHRIEGSEFSDLLRETEDSGVLYMGRDWTHRGNHITGNYIHDFGWKTGSKADGHFGIYLDDQFSSVDIRGNIIVGGHYSVLIGGGRDNRVTGNLFVSPTDVGVFMDDRGKAWQPFGDESSILMKNFRAVDVNSPIWLQRYPELAAMPTNNPGAPLGNVIEDNVAINAPVARGWRRSASALLQESRSRALKAMPRDIAAPSDIISFVSRSAPDFTLPVLADRRAALSGLLFVGRAGLDAPR